MLGRINHCFQIIGVSETWMNDQSSENVDIPGFSFISNHRKTRSGGGVGIYINSHLEYNFLPKSTTMIDEALESIFIEIIVPHSKNIVVGVVYRPPNQYTVEFLESLNLIVSEATKQNKHCYSFLNR